MGHVHVFEHSRLNNQENMVLFIPGPVQVSKSVREATKRGDICHRGKTFQTLFKRVRHSLLEVLELRDSTQYESVIITGSGTSANECALSSIAGKKKVLVISNGEFGERLYKISSLHNDTEIIKYDWGTSIDPKVVASYLENNPQSIVAMVHHETSTGLINPVEEIGRICKLHSCDYFVDCVSSIPADIIDMEKSNISFLSGSSSKAIGSYPGLSFVVGKKKSFETLRNLPPKTAYLDLYKHYEMAKEKDETPNTPAIQLLYSLDAALLEIIEQRKHIRTKNQAIGRLTRSGLSQLGFEFLIPEKDMSWVLTTVKVPTGIDYKAFKEYLMRDGFLVYDGKGPLEDKVFQVGHIGEITIKDVNSFLETVKMALTRMTPIVDVIGLHSGESQKMGVVV